MTVSEEPDFVWCRVRWSTSKQVRGEHICAENKPGHTEHRCCCGAIKPTEEPTP